uniref:Biotin carboxyl carrier protein of acetyl-CoA carboxylase n=1 Tax=Roseihalotalea indica TaxID=2867963 RepID=A0AA49GU38_9BACT|nr:acetyl-CoA carboxylase biotin carboxyl carrier protein [Tunicatimonas sp. TK19036]
MTASEIQSLLDFIATSGLDEVQIETGEIKLKVKKNISPKVRQNFIHSSGVPAMPSDATGLVANTPPAYTTEPVRTSSESSTSQDSTAQDNSKYVAIKSPMIGTFYQAPNPETGPFVQVGDKVSKGQTVCIIEAMKLFNEIEAEQSGTIVEILVEDSSPVEFDQPLFLIDPA